MILLASGLCWVVILRGGMPGIVAWYTFQIGVPLLGLAMLLVVSVYALVKRRFVIPVGEANKTTNSSILTLARSCRAPVWL